MMAKIKTPVIFVLSVSFLALAGCNTTTPTVVESPGYTKQSTLDESHPQARLVLGSEELVGKIRLANVKLRKLGQFTQAQVGVQNLSNRRYNLEYRVEWEDASGFMVDQSGVWRRFTLAPTQIDTITAMGKVPEAHKLVLNVRLPDDVFIINQDKK
jgi:uncharacterized protein YcfL